jgi:hypothetical protein
MCGLSEERRVCARVAARRRPRFRFVRRSFPKSLEGEEGGASAPRSGAGG